MFVAGALPAFLVIYIRTKVDESPAWLQGRIAKKHNMRVDKSILAYLSSFLFLVLLMFAFNTFSHGTQDLYPTFLQKNHGFSPGVVGAIAIIYNIGALFGGIAFGSWSESLGRRRTILVAALLAVPVIPLWAYSHTAPTLALGGFLMQFMVQGAWGVIPAHLNELSPAAVRATFPGLAYQLGNFLASWNSVIQSKLAEQHYAGNYAPVLAWTVLLVATLVVALSLSGKELKGTDLSTTVDLAVPDQ